MQANLDLSCRRTNAGYLSEVGVLNVVVGISITGNVEEVKEVGAKTKHMVLAPNVEFFEQRAIDLAIAWRPLGIIVRRAEG